MGARTSQLQIRVTPAEKEALKRLARAAGETVSGYVLSRVLPTTELQIAGLLRRLGESGVGQRDVLAELRDVLGGLSGPALTTEIPRPEPETLSPVLLNTVAALVESEAHRLGAEPPAWTREVQPLPTPHFGSPLPSLRPLQLRVAPVAFKRRNIFFDPAEGPTP